MRLKTFEQHSNSNPKTGENHLGIRFYNGKPFTFTAKYVDHGEVYYSEVDKLKEDKVNNHISEIVRLIKKNHRVLATNLYERVNKEVDRIFKKEKDNFFFTPVDSSNYESDLEKALCQLINLGYSLGYIRQKYNAMRWSFGEIFQQGTKFTKLGEDFEKVSNKPLNYRGPEVTHYSGLASSYNIKDSLSRENIKYGEEEQDISEISVIFSRSFAYGYDCGAHMVDFEEVLSYEKLGTTKERYSKLISKSNKKELSSEEFEEWIEIRHKEDVIENGKEEADNIREIQKKLRSEWEALSDEEKKEKLKSDRKKSNEFLKRMLDKKHKEKNKS